MRFKPMPRRQQPTLFEHTHGSVQDGVLSVEGAVVREVACKSLLNRSSIGDYSFNCYTGCTNGCVYCYARFMQRFHPHDEPWGRFVDVKVNATDVLAKQLGRLTPGSVFTCSACDGWQPVERHYRLTRQCCQMLLDAGFRLNVLTKSELVLRDLDVFKGRDVCLGVTITTPDEDIARFWEPKASAVSSRLKVLKEAKAAGLETAVMFGPLLPEISDTPEVLAQLFSLAAKAGVDRIWTDTLNPRPRVWPSVQELLRKRWPKLYEHYRSLLFNRTCREKYVNELDQRVRRAACSAGLARLLG